MRLSNPAITALHDRPLLIYASASLILGAQLLSLGLLAELVSVYLRQDDDEFAVVERAGDNDLARAVALGPHGLDRRA